VFLEWGKFLQRQKQSTRQTLGKWDGQGEKNPVQAEVQGGRRREEEKVASQTLTGEDTKTLILLGPKGTAGRGDERPLTKKE